MCCAYVEGEIGVVEREYSGAVQCAWGDVIFVMCYWVCCDANRGGGVGSDFVGDNGWCVVGVVSLGAIWHGFVVWSEGCCCSGMGCKVVIVRGQVGGRRGRKRLGWGGWRRQWGQGRQ